jgi:hypothetical protein
MSSGWRKCRVHARVDLDLEYLVRYRVRRVSGPPSPSLPLSLSLTTPYSLIHNETLEEVSHTVQWLFKTLKAYSRFSFKATTPARISPHPFARPRTTDSTDSMHHRPDRRCSVPEESIEPTPCRSYHNLHHRPVQPHLSIPPSRGEMAKGWF